jgi:hypothetical protein
MSQLDPHVHPAVDSTAVFNKDIFNNKVLFCTGGGSGIGRVMTEAVVRLATDCQTYDLCPSASRAVSFQMRHGANATIVGRK